MSRETILFNEVDVIDVKNYIKIQTVSYVVVNRYFDDVYNQLEDDQQRFKYIDKSVDTEK